MSALRYVVLHHTEIDQPHYDLMFERQSDAPLTTVRCSAWPPAEGATFEPIADHRAAYLDYEGPISGNRGRVTRVESGTCIIDADGSDSLLLSLSSGRKIRIPTTGFEK